jgi:hypothetical protein
MLPLFSASDASSAASNGGTPKRNHSQFMILPTYFFEEENKQYVIERAHEVRIPCPPSGFWVSRHSGSDDAG